MLTRALSAPVAGGIVVAGTVMWRLRPVRILRWVVVGLTAVFAAACGNRTGSGSSVSSQAADADPSTLRYGYAPIRDRSITYQPDVVIVQGGAHAIRSGSADGLVWTIDGTAPGAEQVQPGKVMFVTGRVVGRVFDVRRVGRDLAVTLLPVQLTEIIRNGHLKIDRALPLDQMAFQVIPDLPGAETTAPPGTGITNFSRWWVDPGASPFAMRSVILQDDPGGGGLLPPADFAKARGSFDISVGDWEVRFFLADQQPGERRPSTPPNSGPQSQSKMNWGIRLRHNKGLRFAGQVSFTIHDPHLVADLDITDGTLARPPNIQIDGVEAVDIDVDAGIDNSSSNVKARVLEIPVNFFWQAPPAPPYMPLPTVYSLRLRFLVETALTGKFSTVGTHGSWGISGRFGTNVPAVAITTIQNPINFLRGINIGVSGLVFSLATVVSAGVGTPVINAGPYGKWVLALSFTRGSVLGAPLITCKGSSIIGRLGGGFGLSYDWGKTWDAVAKKLGSSGKPPISVDVKAEQMWTVIERVETIPSVRICTP